MALIIAPILFAASTFFLINGEYGTVAATLAIVSLFFWIPALTGAFSLLKNKMPRYAIYGLWIVVFCAVSGICFMFLGYLTTIFNISHETYLKQLAAHIADILVLIPAVVIGCMLLKKGVTLE